MQAWEVYLLEKRKVIKAKDSPWDAVLMGSVASTVGAKIVQSFKLPTNKNIFLKNPIIILLFCLVDVSNEL